MTWSLVICVAVSPANARIGSTKQDLCIAETKGGVSASFTDDGGNAVSTMSCSSRGTSRSRISSLGRHRGVPLRGVAGLFRSQVGRPEGERLPPASCDDDAAKQPSSARRGRAVGSVPLSGVSEVLTLSGSLPR